MARKLSAMDKQWQAESDARVLTSYQEIMNNSTRKNAATKELQKQIKVAQNGIKSLKKK